MKKRIVFTLVAAIVGLFAFTGCQKEQAFSFYQIGAVFSGIDYTLTTEQVEELPIADKEKYKVAIYLDKWLSSNGFIRNTTQNNPFVVESDDEEYNDSQATILYNNMTVELGEKNKDNGLDKLIVAAQKKIGSDGIAALVITEPGSITFRYYMTKGSIASSKEEWTKTYTVIYGPLPLVP